MEQLPFTRIMFGADPEFFFTKNEKVIGSEKVLPEKGIVLDESSYGRGKIVRDGVQVEINPAPNPCREHFRNDISNCFKALKKQLDGKDIISVNFSEVVEVEKDELESLSAKSRTFGCMPSTNIYDGKSKIKVDPSVYRYRSAGGHIHLGVYGGDSKELAEKARAILEQPNRVVPMLDIVLGNTSVLLDRDPWAKERRKVYGKAGEYRTPKWGIEYRTPSNFWLRSYQLMSLVTGLARTAVLITAFSSKENDYEKEILSNVKIDNIRTAINENDFDLAYENYKKIEDILVEAAGDNTNNFPINRATQKEFHHFIEKGIDYFFKEDPLDHWTKTNRTDEDYYGIERFLMNNVHEDMIKKGN